MTKVETWKRLKQFGVVAKKNGQGFNLKGVNLCGCDLKGVDLILKSKHYRADVP